MFSEEILQDEPVKQLIMAGKALDYRNSTPAHCIQELGRVKAIKFDIERAVSEYVYENSRTQIEKMLEVAENISGNYTFLEQDSVKTHAYLLPVWQAALNISSKANFKYIFGSASDRLISGPSSLKIATYANDYFSSHKIDTIQIKERIERTLEGIVRDLVGRLLFESIVENALDNAEVPYLTEKEYSGIEGVVYTIRADFVIPNPDEPMAFIEVRKSSSRHASLYAKDKMFSAINWKGKHREMLGIIVTEGDWTNESLKTMSHVFDYVIPISSVKELATKIEKYLAGDKSILKWIIDFKISPNEAEPF